MGLLAGTEVAPAAAEDASQTPPLFNPNSRQIDAADVRGIVCRYLPQTHAAGFRVNDVSLYRRALVHRSYSVRSDAKRGIINRRCPIGVLPIQRDSYERLEFLGDAVLGLSTAAYLFARYPDEDEGFLTQMRTKLINGRTLASLCKQTPLPRFVVIAAGSPASPQPAQIQPQQIQPQQIQPQQIQPQQIQPDASTPRQALARNVLEDVFEAFLGALFVDSGFHIADRFIVGFLEHHVDFAELAATRDSAKSVLNRHCMRTLGFVPLTETLDAGVVRLMTPGGAVISTGVGVDAKDAEDDAARRALVYYGIGR